MEEPCSRWLSEPSPGLYFGTVSARVRDELWYVGVSSERPVTGWLCCYTCG
ncbi:type I-E CRISPR-associated endoribonuclease Cas2 [Nonomuraea dietziae]|uniref:type I-E CRISPR-associated endoribonuclease Cas2 n=1 Tax=Nonomuraea dietziae TaxID=65515 RepID=UPI0031D4F5E6